MSNKADFNLLFADFKPHLTSDWAKAAEAENEGKDPISSLSWNKETISGKPYYDKSDLPTSEFQLPQSTNPFLGPRAWQNMPLISVINESESNTAALHHLKNGADGILFDLRTLTTINFEKLLKDIDWPYCSVAFRLPSNHTEHINNLSKFIQQKNWDISTLHGFILWNEIPTDIQLLNQTFKGFTNFKFITVEISEGPIVNQLSSCLAIGKQHQEVSAHIGFSLPIGTDFFLEIGKLKALRALWNQIDTNNNLYIHAQSNPWIKEAFQPHGSLLKSTMAGMAAVAGGCDALTISPESESDSIMNRIARNVSNILREESHLNKVADATAGSYYVESLVNQLVKNIQNSGFDSAQPDKHPASILAVS
jgi:methylmalonyl-CoA mutase